MTTMTAPRVATLWLTRPKVEKICGQLYLDKEATELVVANIRAISLAAQQEAAQEFPNAQLVAAVNFDPQMHWVRYRDAAPAVDFDSIIDVLNSELLIAAVQRRKHRALSTPAMTLLHRFVNDTTRLHV